MNNKSEQHRGLKLRSQIQSIRLAIEAKQCPMINKYKFKKNDHHNLKIKRKKHPS
jgi:hypothetical protein